MDAAKVSAQISQRLVEVVQLTLTALDLFGTAPSLLHPRLLGVLRGSARHTVQDRLTEPPPVILRKGECFIQDPLGRRGHEDKFRRL
jgi:hypothetical protein